MKNDSSRIASLAFLAISTLMLPLGTAWAFNQPPANFGATTFLDGGGSPPGIYLMEYLQHVAGPEAVDKNGDVLAGGARISALVLLNQFYYLTPLKIGGGYIGLDAILPVVAPAGQGSVGAAPVTSNLAGLGDFAAGIAWQWNEHTLLGRPFYHRLESLTTLPTGSYNERFGMNAGSNLLSQEVYHAFTWLFAKKWETSWRMGYIFNGSNDAIQVKPGQLFHLNYAFSREVHPKLRLGAAGYFLQQTTDDKINGVSASGTRERALALGPGLMYTAPNIMVALTHPVEIDARNRFRGHRTTLQFILRL